MEPTLCFEQVRKAARDANRLELETINDLLVSLADELHADMQDILAANAIDLSKMDCADPMYDRLLLTEDRLLAIADDIRHVAALPSPLGVVLSERVRPNGMVVEKVSVPLGVVGVIYEARPNVTFDVFSLCLKSGNATVLKGGSDAQYTNEAIVRIIRNLLIRKRLNPNLVMLLPSDRTATAALLQAVGQVDVIIPRGSQRLIEFVRRESRVPIIETGAGICHAYFDRSADLVKGEAIVFNGKTRRVSVCNALDCLIIHQDRLADLPRLCERLALKEVVIFADRSAFDVLSVAYPSQLLHLAEPEHFGMEFLSYRMSIRTVDSLVEALEHIARYSSKHSEVIITEEKKQMDRFRKEVDAACVYVNVSTSFTDGAQFGLGAEIGISTQKLHARGPMGLEELTSYKYLISGNGQVRE